MKQILTVAGNSLKKAFKDKVFITITVLFLMLSVISVFIGSSTKNAEMKAYQDIVQLLKAQGAQNFPEPPQIFPLAILQNIIQYISMIGAVLAVFLGFDAFNGERENGTLKLMLTRPLYRDQVITGKIFGGAFVIGLLLGITLIFNTILFIAVSGLMLNLNELSRLFIFIIIGFLYMMSFYVASLYVSIKVRNRGFGFMTMMIVWVIVSFVIPQLADTQRSFAYALNSTAQTVTQMPSDTIVSKTIEIFSPAVQFKNIGRDLLQVVSETSSINVLEILARQALSLLYMLAPGVVILIASYRAVQKEAVL